MAELAKKDIPVARECGSATTREVLRVDRREVQGGDNLGDSANEDISLYREGDFIDLCRGPTSRHGQAQGVQADEGRGRVLEGRLEDEMLQRIYGTAWRRRKTRTPTCTCWRKPRSGPPPLGAQLDLFHCRTRPRHDLLASEGLVIWQQVEQHMRRVYQDNGYQECAAADPRQEPVEKSGHWENYKDNMFTTESEKRDFAIKR